MLAGVDGCCSTAVTVVGLMRTPEESTRGLDALAMSTTVVVTLLRLLLLLLPELVNSQLLQLGAETGEEDEVDLLLHSANRAGLECANSWIMGPEKKPSRDTLV